MKVIKTNKRLGVLITASLIALIFILSLYVLLIPKVEATNSNELVVEDFSTENAVITRYSNIKGFVDSKETKTRNISMSQKEKLYSALGLTEDELSGIDPNSLLNARSIMISETLIAAPSEGDIQTYAIPVKTSEKNFSDIPNDNGKTGYMTGKIIMVQDPAYDKVNKNKDGEITKFLAYGFEVSFTMKWLTLPAYTMKDYFTFVASNNAFVEESYSCTFSADAYSYDAENTANSRSYVVYPEVSYYSSGGWPVFNFNLPSHVSTPINSLTYSNYRLSARARLFSLDDFNIIMSYAHKQLVLGDLNVSISTSGPSISFGGTSHREYQTPNFFIDLIKDPAMEALKE